LYTTLGYQTYRHNQPAKVPQAAYDRLHHLSGARAMYLNQLFNGLLAAYACGK
jgi:hypothetical protein